MRRPARPHSLLRLGALAAVVALSACGGGRDPVTGLHEVLAPAAPGSAEPNLTLAPSGRVLLSWLEPAADSTHALRFAVRENGEWGAPRSVARGRGWFVNWADFPSLLALSDSVLAAHWLVRSGGSPYAYDVHVALSRDGGASWSAPIVPHRDGTQSEHGFVAMWPAGTEAVGLAWLDGRKFPEAEARRRAGDTTAVTEMTLRAARLGLDGSLADEAELDGRICDCCQTAAALTAEGPIVAYRDRSPGEVRDIAVTRRAGGRWTAGRRVAEDGWVINGCPVNGPALAADGRDVVVAWYTMAGGERRVYAAFSSDAGASFGRRIRVDDGAPLGRVAVVLDGADRALVSWLEETGGDAEVRVRRVAADSTVGPAATVARTAAGRPAGFPRMVRSGDELVFAWTLPAAGASPSAVRTAVARLAR